VMMVVGLVRAFVRLGMSCCLHVLINRCYH
jgi:hypothetical protein